MPMGDSRRGFLAASAALAAAGALHALGGEQDKEEPKQDADRPKENGEMDLSKAEYTVRPIGVIRNRKGEPVRLEIFKKYTPGLLRMEHCKKVVVIWWFHKNDTPKKRGVLKVHPRGNSKNPLTGVFATHSPCRPNLIAITTCKVLSVEDGTITIEGIDAFDGTPIIDLKSG